MPLTRMKRQKKGFTLVETVIVFAVMAVMVPTVVVGLNTLVVQSTRAEKLTVATDLARYYMELALSKRFDENIPAICNGASCAQPTWSSTLGTDTGESCTIPSDSSDGFDDVDDFNCLSTATAIPGFSEYTLRVNVAYLTVNADGTWGTSDCTGGCVPPTNAKRIRVIVNHALTGDVSLDAITGANY